MRIQIALGWSSRGTEEKSVGILGLDRLLARWCVSHGESSWLWQNFGGQGESLRGVSLTDVNTEAPVGGVHSQAKLT